jgi:hypothetical protein
MPIAHNKNTIEKYIKGLGPKKQKTKKNIFAEMVLIKLTVISLNICCIDRIMSHTPHTPHTAYHLFSKRQYEKGGSYNFGKKKEYDRAEKWFKERKEIRQELITAPTILIAPTAPTAPTILIAPTALAKPIRLATRGPPPGLTRQKQDNSCDLDLTIPSYNDFIYREEIFNLL